MSIAVLGMWHLGTVTAGCLAEAGYDVIGYDQDCETVTRLQNGELPVDEPGLGDQIQRAIESGRLQFTSQAKCVAACNIYWVAYDTPVDDYDQADAEFVVNSVEKIFPYVKDNDLIIVSSQLPVCTTSQLEVRLRVARPDISVSLACLPENLRLGKAIAAFAHPDRVVAGVRQEKDKLRIAKLLAPFTQNIIWMSVESAEMTKHAINSFLATSVAFINELALICEQYGADASEVEQGLKSDSRIGPQAYLKPGPAFSGGTLARDVRYLLSFGQAKKIPTHLFVGVSQSNEAHKSWPRQKLLDLFGACDGKRIAILGLTYKPGTNTLRRSEALENSRWLKQRGAELTAYDPAVVQLPAEFEPIIRLCASIGEALDGAEAVFVSTTWPEFKKLRSEDILSKMDRPVVIDPSGFLADNFKSDPRIIYLKVGRPNET